MNDDHFLEKVKESIEDAKEALEKAGIYASMIRDFSTRQKALDLLATILEKQ